METCLLSGRALIQKRNTFMDTFRDTYKDKIKYAMRKTHLKRIRQHTHPSKHMTTSHVVCFMFRRTWVVQAHCFPDIRFVHRKADFTAINWRMLINGGLIHDQIFVLIVFIITYCLTPQVFVAALDLFVYVFKWSAGITINSTQYLIQQVDQININGIFKIRYDKKFEIIAKA